MENITSCESTCQSVSKDTPKKPSYIANNIKPITEEPTSKAAELNLPDNFSM
ncbi:unnamed protein product [Plutella xylostella]|uniref:(diamondback moth) hypothetical protein n=1 Tax=Plutella xylostella TaxID=51655 RepID=A0A8S4G527_PLUXY|nr:unnamed protein product [Plutella xylostella]